MAEKICRSKHDQSGVTVVSAKDYLYSKVIPKHLRKPAKATTAQQTTDSDQPVSTGTAEPREEVRGAETDTAVDEPKKRGRPKSVHDRVKSFLMLRGSSDRTSSLQDVRTRRAAEDSEVKKETPGRLTKTRTQSFSALRRDAHIGQAQESHPVPVQSPEQQYRGWNAAVSGDSRTFGFDRNAVQDGEYGDKDDGYCGLRKVSSSAEASSSWWKSGRHMSREDWFPPCMRPPQATGADCQSERSHVPSDEHAGSPPENRNQQLAHRSGATSVGYCRNIAHEESSVISRLSHESEQFTAEKRTLMEEGCRLAFPDVARYIKGSEDEVTRTAGKDSAEHVLFGKTTEGDSSNERTEHSHSSTEVSLTMAGELLGFLDDNTASEHQSASSSVNEECRPTSVCRNRRESDASLNTSMQTSEDQVSVSRAMNMLKTCTSCLLPSSDLTLMQCFHLLCTACLTPLEETVRCGVCKTEQAVPQDGVALIKDMFPGLFVTGDTSLKAWHSTVGPSDDPPEVSKESVNTELQLSHGESKITVSLESDTIFQTASKSKLCGGQSKTERSDIGEAHSTEIQESQTLEKTLSGNLIDQSEMTSATDGKLFSRSGQNRAGNFDNDHSDLDSSFASASSPSSGSYTLDRAPVAENEGSSSNHNMPTTADQTRQICGACQEEASTEHVCVTCGGILLCSGCRTAHLNLPVTRSHEVVPRDLSASPLSPLTLLSHHQPACPEHGQDLALLCCTCSVFLCHRCLTPQHAHHVVQELATVFHASRKRFSGLQRSIKQHLLAARSSAKDVKEQLHRVRTTRREACDAIQTAVERHVARLTSNAKELSDHVERVCEAKLAGLSKAESDVMRVREEGDALRCLMNAVSEDTPQLTRLILQSNCQVRFDQLRQQAPLCVEDLAGEDMVFRADALLSDHMNSGSPLGTVRSLASSVPDIALTIMAVLRTGGEVNAIAATPYNELVCVSSTRGTCQVWDQHGVMLADVSRHVTRPSDVQVTPSGIVVVLGADGTACSSKGSRAACLTFMSPAGSLLGRLPLPSEVHLTHVHCPSDSHVLVSDTVKQQITLYAVEGLRSPQGPRATTLRQFSHPTALRHPRNVTETVAGDWLVNDRGGFMKLVSREGHVTTVLTEDEPDAAIQPPRSFRNESCYYSDRFLTSVCCDSRGRMMAADCGKNGLYVITVSESSGHGERHFVSLQELTSAFHVTCMTVDQQNHIIVGMSDGCVYTLKMAS